MTDSGLDDSAAELGDEAGAVLRVLDRLDPQRALSDSALRSAVARYAARARARRHRPEAVIVRLKGLVGRAWPSPGDDTLRRAVQDRIAVWAIEAYFGLTDPLG